MLQNDSVSNIGKVRLMRFVRLGLAAGLLAGGANVALAQTSQTPTTPQDKQAIAAAKDEGLSWHGITLYGIVDLGLQYQRSEEHTSELRSQ